MKQPGLFPLVRTRVRELLAGYVAAPELEDGLDGYIVPPALGDRSGVLGAIALAQAAVP
jgi:fructokinase